ncbi:LOW QUALITY PROTEIN: probable aspartic proteinase GIP1 [Malania oleifera]|uniref:LOW QUALITY PROTEIN: probable aspartic proteinase GIP1 n=1 Tax=Malania oleifera TaxID=397392 RepID=UPI0025ADDA7E|nr:LOW QUALITY PROTEIN: probable aspartic proteinase GIP1 [Malania oleifera]
MAMSLPHFFFFFFFFSASSSALPLQTGTALLAPITKDPSTLQYTVPIYLKTPLQPTKLLLDLGASFSWVDCQKSYRSSTYRHVRCNSSLCASLHSLACSNCYDAPVPACGNDTCALFPENSVTREASLANAIIDSLALPFTDGRNPGRLALLSEFLFSCSPTSLLKGLAAGITGLVALGRSNISLPAQVTSAFSSPYVFALCFSGSPSAPGVAFFGTRGPYYFLPETDLSKSLIYTPLLLNPRKHGITYSGHPSDEYYVGVSSVKVNGKAIQLNGSLLTVDQNGFGGTKLSTIAPYTILEASIYRVFTQAFVSEAAALNLTAVTAPVPAPFSVCYPADDVGSTLVGPAVPTVDLVMQSDDVFWRIFGSNSMVRMAGGNRGDVWCLGFVDGGVNARTSIVIGGHQMEDNLLQFDLGLKRLGFSSSVLLKRTMCANFNFTSNNNL